MKYDVVGSPWGDGSIYQVPIDDAGNAAGPGEQVRCSGRVETADRRDAADFPLAWGTPPAGQFTEARARWVAEHAAESVREQWVRGGSAQAALAMVKALDA
ncbi:hypothetical protein ACQHIV_15865 [Kribbella sp. GL6]|uniref:hypothetical protein n=1 Tax=Kribbella sp. GL6 TaxID=3419765 RepID=UPI003CFD73CF